MSYVLGYPQPTPSGGRRAGAPVHSTICATAVTSPMQVRDGFSRLRTFKVRGASVHTGGSMPVLCPSI